MAGLDSENRLVDKSLAEQKLALFEQDPHAETDLNRKRPGNPGAAAAPILTVNSAGAGRQDVRLCAAACAGYGPEALRKEADDLSAFGLQYLPANQFGEANTILANLANAGDTAVAGWVPAADTKIKSRAWNDKKISAHHAIIPTTVKANVLTMTAEERNL